MKNTLKKFYGKHRKILENSYFRRVSVLFLLTIVVLTFSHAYNVKTIEAEAQALHEIETRCEEIYIDGKCIGQVRNKETYEDIVMAIKGDLQEKEGMDIKILNNIDLVKSHAEDNELTKINEISRNLQRNIEYDILAYAIEVDGEIIGELPSKEEANQLLEEIKSPYYSSAKAIESCEVEIVQDVKIKEVDVPKEDIKDYEELLYYVQKGTDIEKTHTVKEGENNWAIAAQYNLSVEDLIAANPETNLNLIYPGDELSLILPKPYIEVRTKEIAIFEEKVSYDTEYEKVSWLYSDEYQTKTSGEYGTVEVKAEIIKENGIEVSKNILEEKTIEAPITEVLYNGSIEPPPKKGTGYFNNPLPTGYVSSRYGPRWSGFHHGMDIASASGTPIKAADGGEVVFAGWYGDYGYMVEIDHGGGFTTRYAHCSKIYVGVGEKVYQGKKIAAVGTTGFATGPHVHFEVRKYGSTVNPQSYIGTQYR